MARISPAVNRRPRWNDVGPWLESMAAIRPADVTHALCVALAAVTVHQGVHVQGGVLHLCELTNDQPQRVAPFFDYPTSRCGTQSDVLRGGGEW